MSSAYEDLVARATADPDVVGLILTGSAARGMSTVHSDHDVLVVLDAFTEAWPEPAVHTPELDTIPCLIDGIADTGTWWQRWQYRGARILLDRTDGQILAGLCEQQYTLTPAEADARAREFLGGYINFCYRAAKSRRERRTIEAQLDAAESAGWFLEALFALYGRVRPYNKYLRWELEQFPLGDPWDARTLPERLIADPGLLFDDLELIARERGYGDEYDSWDEIDLALLRRS